MKIPRRFFDDIFPWLVIILITVTITVYGWIAVGRGVEKTLLQIGAQIDQTIN